MKGQESLFSQVFVLAISMFAVWITFVYSAFFKFNKNLQKNSAELIYRKCSPRKFCRINLQLYVCNMFFISCFFFLKKWIISAKKYIVFVEVFFLYILYLFFADEIPTEKTSARLLLHMNTPSDLPLQTLLFYNFIKNVSRASIKK